MRTAPKTQPTRNRYTIADLADLDPAIIAKLPVEELALLQSDLAEEQERLKRASIRLCSGLEMRYQPQIAHERERKFYGVVHIQDGDYDVAVDLPKRVSWDTDVLGKAITSGKLTLEQADEYVRYKYDVLESVYKGAPDDVRKILDTARTVAPGAAKYMITHKGGAA